jgi:hypothetical protein
MFNTTLVVHCRPLSREGPVSRQTSTNTTHQNRRRRWGNGGLWPRRPRPAPDLMSPGTAHLEPTRDPVGDCSFARNHRASCNGSPLSGNFLSIMPCNRPDIPRYARRLQRADGPARLPPSRPRPQSAWDAIRPGCHPVDGTGGAHHTPHWLFSS